MSGTLRGVSRDRSSLHSATISSLFYFLWELFTYICSCFLHAPGHEKVGKVTAFRAFAHLIPIWGMCWALHGRLWSLGFFL